LDFNSKHYNAICFSPDGSKFAYVSREEDGDSCYVQNIGSNDIDSKSPSQKLNLNKELCKHYSFVSISPDNKLIVLASETMNCLVVYDLIKNTFKGSIETDFKDDIGEQSAIAFGPNGQQLAITLQSGAIEIIDLKVVMNDKFLTAKAERILKKTGRGIE
jgi:WD40 repeat protein